MNIDLSELDLPKTMKMRFPVPEDLLNFELDITPDEGEDTFEGRHTGELDILYGPRGTVTHWNRPTGLGGENFNCGKEYRHALKDQHDNVHGAMESW